MLLSPFSLNNSELSHKNLCFKSDPSGPAPSPRAVPAWLAGAAPSLASSCPGSAQMSILPHSPHPECTLKLKPTYHSFSLNTLP